MTLEVFCPGRPHPAPPPTQSESFCLQFSHNNLDPPIGIGSETSKP